MHATKIYQEQSQLSPKKKVPFPRKNAIQVIKPCSQSTEKRGIGNRNNNIK